MILKRISAIVMALILCLLLVACGGIGDGNTDKTNNTTSATVSGQMIGGTASGEQEQSTADYIVSTEKVEITAPNGSVIATQFQTVTHPRTNTTTLKPSGNNVSSQNTTASKTQSTTIKIPTTDDNGEDVVYVSLSEDRYRTYALLSDSQKQIYSKIKDAITDLNTTVDLKGVNQTDVKIAYTAVNMDNPQLIWFPRGYSLSVSGDNYRMMFSYNYTKEQCDKMKSELDAAVNAAFMSIKGSKDQYTTELRLHDYLASKVTYQAASELSYTAYGALVQGKAVCEGYSRAMQILLNRAGIECSLVTGISHDQGHMWNLVKIDGSWYHLDVTWNDVSDKGYHTYFNVSDAIILLDHTIEGSVKTNVSSLPNEFNIDLPLCNTMKANYCNKIGTLVDSKQDFENKALNYFATHEIKSGTAIEFCFSEKYDRRFYSSMTDMSDFIVKYNNSVGKDKKIPGGYTISGPAESKGFMIVFK